MCVILSDASILLNPYIVKIVSPSSPPFSISDGLVLCLRNAWFRLFRCLVDPGPFVICGFESYILTLFSLSYMCIYEIVIYTSQSGTFFYVVVYIYFVNIYLSYFSYQLKDSLMSLCLCYLSLLLCLVLYKYIYDIPEKI